MFRVPIPFSWQRETKSHRTLLNNFLMYLIADRDLFWRVGSVRTLVGLTCHAEGRSTWNPDHQLSSSSRVLGNPLNLEQLA